MAKKNKSPDPKGYIIVAYVWSTRSGSPTEFFWHGKEWSKTTAKLYRTRREAEKAADAIDDREMDSVEIHAMPGDIAF